MENGGDSNNGGVNPGFDQSINVWKNRHVTGNAETVTTGIGNADQIEPFG